MVLASMKGLPRQLNCVIAATDTSVRPPDDHRTAYGWHGGAAIRRYRLIGSAVVALRLQRRRGKVKSALLPGPGSENGTKGRLLHPWLVLHYAALTSRLTPLRQRGRLKFRCTRGQHLATKAMRSIPRDIPNAVVGRQMALHPAMGCGRSRHYARRAGRRTGLRSFERTQYRGGTLIVSPDGSALDQCTVALPQHKHFIGFTGTTTALLSITARVWCCFSSVVQP